MEKKEAIKLAKTVIKHNKELNENVITMGMSRDNKYIKDREKLIAAMEYLIQEVGK